MLAKTDIILDSGENELSYLMGSSFHGALMKMLDTDYISKLHESQLHPYTQHLELDTNGTWHWIITVLNDEAAENIIHYGVMQKDEIYLNKHKFKVNLSEKNYTELSDSEIDRYYNFDKAKRNIILQFVTPTAFKQKGKYINYPDLRLLFLSFMKKFSSARREEMPKEETLNWLIKDIAITDYALSSTYFSLEGIKIPAFMGNISLKFEGPLLQANLGQMLAHFSSYSGVGIKTAMGMGAVKIIK